MRVGERRIDHQLAGRLRDALVVDVRPHHDRLAEGEIENSVVVERIVLEWRLDPTGDWRLPGFTADTTVVVVCNEGWASSLAARDLRRIGLANATDLVGGYGGRRAAGGRSADPGGRLTGGRLSRNRWRTGSVWRS